MNSQYHYLKFSGICLHWVLVVVVFLLSKTDLQNFPCLRRGLYWLMAWHLDLRGSASVELRDDRAVSFEEQVAWEIVVSHQITYLVAHHCPSGYSASTFLVSLTGSWNGAGHSSEQQHSINLTSVSGLLTHACSSRTCSLKHLVLYLVPFILVLFLQMSIIHWINYRVLLPDLYKRGAKGGTQTKRKMRKPSR